MRLFVGLGNPGAQYARNRHNVGFMAVDRIAAEHGFTPWRGRFQGLVAEGRLGSEKVALLKPQTFMNLSGQSVGEAARFWKIAPDEITVFHDELDLAPFKVRLKAGGGHAGHNGLRSIHAHIGEAYRRVRIGIGRPADKAQVMAYVLGDFPKGESDGLDRLLEAIARGAGALATGDDDAFMRELAARNGPSGANGHHTGKGRAAHLDEPAAPKAAPDAPAEPDPRSILERLRDRSR